MRPYTLVYDGTCRMCTRVAHVLERWDSRSEIEVVPSQAAGVMARFPWIPARAYDDAMQLIGPDGATWQGADAVEKLLDVLPRGGWARWIFHLPFARALADQLYRWVARNRYRLGCGAHCRRLPR